MLLGLDTVWVSVRACMCLHEPVDLLTFRSSPAQGETLVYLFIRSSHETQHCGADTRRS